MRIPGLWRAQKIQASLNKRKRDRYVENVRERVERFPLGHKRSPHGLSKPLVVSLTSYAPRFPNLSLTLRSLLDQNVAADGTVLWLTNEDRARVPAEVLSLQDHGLKIQTCDDWLSYKKLAPALLEDPDRYIVTADDDVYYPRGWLETLVTRSKQDPGKIVSTVARRIAWKPDGSFQPYGQWPNLSRFEPPPRPDELIIPIGSGGVLYPPGCLHPKVTDHATFLRVAPHGDDLWFFWMSRLLGTRHLYAPTSEPIVEWPGSQDVALKIENLYNHGNDQQINALLERFGFPDVGVSALADSTPAPQNLSCKDPQ